MIKEKEINQALDRAYLEFKPFSYFYQREKKTYNYLLNLVAGCAESGQKIVDVGTGIGIVPLALKFLGFESSGIDKYIFNMPGLDKIKEVWQKNGLSVFDCDMAKEQKDISGLGSFDIVLSSSTVEHVQSPRLFLENIKSLL